MKLLQTIVNIRDDDDEETCLFISRDPFPIPLEDDVIATTRGDRRVMQRYFSYQHVGQDDMELTVTLFVQPAIL